MVDRPAQLGVNRKRRNKEKRRESTYAAVTMWKDEENEIYHNEYLNQ